MTGKVALMIRPKCSAGIFAVAKRNSECLREVSDVCLISAASVKPSKPRLLADPVALTALEASLDQPLYMSSRDGACFYDQLALPGALVPYFGRPQVRVRELCEPLCKDDDARGHVGGCCERFSLEQVRSLVRDLDGRL